MLPGGPAGNSFNSSAVGNRPGGDANGLNVDNDVNGGNRVLVIDDGGVQSLAASSR